MSPRPRFFPSPPQLRSWFEKHHDRARELQIGFYKKDSGRKSVIYQEALDQALCFGWIDGIRHRRDDISYTIRFTPRKARSKWSAVNIKHFTRLEKLGLVKPSGRKAFEERDTKAAPYSFEAPPQVLSPAYEKKLRDDPRAWAFFQAQPPWYRRTSTHWVMSAKQEATRQRRLAALIECSAKREWIGPLKR